MRRRVLAALRPLDAVAIENLLEKGTPDVEYLGGGWLELKSVERWPPRGGPVKCDHFTPEQRMWLRRRCRAGGSADLLVRVGNDWLLLKGLYAAERFGYAPKPELIERAWRYWEGGLDEKELLHCLTPPRLSENASSLPDVGATSPSASSPSGSE